MVTFYHSGLYYGLKIVVIQKYATIIITSSDACIMCSYCLCRNIFGIAVTALYFALGDGIKIILFQFCCLSFKLQHKKIYLLTCASNKHLNQLAHPHCLIRVFIVRCRNSATLSVHNVPCEYSDETVQKCRMI